MANVQNFQHTLLISYKIKFAKLEKINIKMLCLLFYLKWKPFLSLYINETKCIIFITLALSNLERST